MGTIRRAPERNIYIVRDMLSEAQAPGKHTAARRWWATYYGSCMDESAIEKKGTAPLTPEMERINGIKTKAEIYPAGGLHAPPSASGAVCLLPPARHARFDARPLHIIDQGGITLPDRDYYMKDDPKSVETRQKYVEHVQKMFELAGDKPEVAAAEAKTVLAVETGLAQAVNGPHGSPRSQDSRP